MAARKVQLKDNSGNKAYPVTSSACVGMSDGSGSLDSHISKITTEYNVSLFHPTEGIDGGNKYTLETAIDKVPAELRNAGVKVSFLDESGSMETWEFQGESWAKGSFSQVGAGELTELDTKITNKLTATSKTNNFLIKDLCQVGHIGENGDISGDSSFVSNIIPIEPGETLYADVISGYYDRYLDENFNIISVIRSSISNGVPYIEGAKYIQMSIHKNTKAICKNKEHIKYPDYPVLLDETLRLEEVLKDNLSITSFDIQGFAKVNDLFDSNDSYRRTDYIPYLGGSIKTFNLEYNNQYVYFVVFYDNNKKAISGLSKIGDFESYEISEGVIPEGTSYIIYSTTLYKSNTASAVLNVLSVGEKLGELKKQIENNVSTQVPPLGYHISKNLFNPDNIGKGWIKEDGYDENNDYIYSSEYIQCVEGDVFRWINFKQGGNYRAGFFDLNKNFISSVLVSESHATAPEGSAYFKICVAEQKNKVSNDHKKYAILTKNEEITEYEPYGIISDNYNSLDIRLSDNLTELDFSESEYGYPSSRFIPVKGGDVIYGTCKESFFLYVFTDNLDVSKASSGKVDLYYNKKYILPEGSKYIILAGSSSEKAKISINKEALNYKPYEHDNFLLISYASLRQVLPSEREDISMPKTYYSHSDYSFRIYKKAILRRMLSDFIIGSDTYIDKSDRIEQTISSDKTGKISLYDCDFNTLKSIDVSVKKSSGTSGNPLKIHAIGDSITNMCNQYFKTNSVLSGLTFVGTCKSKMSSDDELIYLQNDGRSGWTLTQYVSGGTIHSPNEWAGFSPFLHPKNKIYNYYGCTKYWIWESDGSDWWSRMFDYIEKYDINTETGLLNNPKLNDVMYKFDESKFVVWDGGSWSDISLSELANSEVSDEKEAFEVDYSKFLSIWQIDKPDVVFIQLGTNDYSRTTFVNAIDNFNSTFKSGMDELITSIHAVDASIKVVVMIPPMFSLSDSINGSLYSQFTKNAALWEERKLLVDSYDSREGESIYCLDSGSALNPLEDLSSDGTHPNSTGFDKLAERIISFIQYIRNL